MATPSAASAERPRRGIVSFVRRGSRLSRSRQAAWDRCAQRWVLELPEGERDTLPSPDARLDLGEVFGRRAPLVVEIGSGQGENIARAAADHPERDHLAFEVYRPGIAQTLDNLERAGSPTNVRLLALDALGALPLLLDRASIREAWIFFPDPWHKARHHKRRLVNPPLLDALLPRMEEGGVLRLATDWSAYALHMREILDADPRLTNLHPEGPRPVGTSSDPLPEQMPVQGWAPRFTGRVLTSFERKSRDADRLTWDLVYRCTAAAGTPPDSAAPADRLEITRPPVPESTPQEAS